MSIQVPVPDVSIVEISGGTFWCCSIWGMRKSHKGDEVKVFYIPMITLYTKVTSDESAF